MDIRENELEYTGENCGNCGGSLLKKKDPEVEIIICENHFNLSKGKRSCGEIERNIFCHTCQEYSATSLVQSNQEYGEESGVIYCESCDSRRVWNS